MIYDIHYHKLHTKPDFSTSSVTLNDAKGEILHMTPLAAEELAEQLIRHAEAVRKRPL